jgi:DNA polymerase-4
LARSTTLPAPTDDTSDIYSHVSSLLDKTEVGKRPVRLLGISLSQLVNTEVGNQLPLLLEERRPKKKRELNAALDSISEKFGDKGVLPGTLLTK